MLNEEKDSEDSFSTNTSKKVKNTTDDPVGEGDTETTTRTKLA